MPRRGSARADAVRRAHQAKAARDARRQQREAQIDAALADYYQAAAQAEQIRVTARQKRDEMLAGAERSAAPQDAAAARAVHRLRDLLGGIAETAQLCGLSAAAVREILTGRQPGQDVGSSVQLAPSEGE